MSKFKVGDYIDGHLNDNRNKKLDHYKIVTKIDRSQYYYDVYNLDGTFKCDMSYSIASIDRFSELYLKRIKDTKIARKMNKDKIIKEEDNYLIIAL